MPGSSTLLETRAKRDSTATASARIVPRPRARMEPFTLRATHVDVITMRNDGANL
jgi:hypothetical protein